MKDMGVSKNRGGPPKWMVKIMENPIKMDDLGGKNPYFWFNTHIYIKKLYQNINSLQLVSTCINMHQHAPESPRTKPKRLSSDATLSFSGCFSEVFYPQKKYVWKTTKRRFCGQIFGAGKPFLSFFVLIEFWQLFKNHGDFGGLPLEKKLPTISSVSFVYTTEINMEPNNHQSEQENHFPNLHVWVPC